MDFIDISNRICYTNFNYCNNSYKNSLESSSSDENEGDHSLHKLS